MNHHVTRSLLAGLLILIFAANTWAWERGKVSTFALLPEGSANPEAITVSTDGTIYVSTFGSGEVLSFSPKGELLHSITVTPSSGFLLDLDFHPDTGALLVVDFMTKQVLDVDPATGSATVFAKIRGGENAGPNVITFDDGGNVYVADSFQGKIWRTGPYGGKVVAWASDELLLPQGYPPFGANGMAFSNDGTALFVANTANDTIVKIPVDQDGRAMQAELFVEGINGPDGIAVDENDNIWIAANLDNEITVIDPTGTVIAVVGDFDGISDEGVVQGLLFPSDLVIAAGCLYVPNFAFDLTSFDLPRNYLTDWTRQVKHHSIAHIKTKLLRKRN